MNRSRVVVLVAAAFAAGIVALLVRGFLGGGTPDVKAAIAPAPAATEDVLVAATNLQPGVAITPESVRWQTWPKSAVDSSFITSIGNSDIASIVKGTVARAPMIAGEPLSNTKFVHADTAGFMAAQLAPGMRAVSISISADTGAGGFILPNDRVDVILTLQISDNPRRFMSKTLVSDVRVLAMDQTFTQDKDQKTVLAKTATLELTPIQADLVALSAATGTISLALRPLGDNDVADSAAKTHHADDGSVTVIRYGISRGGFDSKGE
ncbi:MAG TPA: Flp pilus assembly protein CpaB [Rhizomicrobium sp.]|nr:Flp pilus assembly protein CpaB [Rhizomicrobium sp.]